MKIYVEQNYVRAVKGGMGFTKTAGNYAASSRPRMRPKRRATSGFDGVERKYIGRGSAP